MTRTYCDKCGNEIHDEGARGRNTTCEEMHGAVMKADGLSFTQETKLLSFKILVEPMGGKHVCKYCILDVIAELDDRPTNTATTLATLQTATITSLAPVEPHETYPVK